MKTRRLPSLLIALCALAAPVLAGDLNGRWWGDATLGGTFPVQVYLILQGNTIKGTGGPNASQQDILIGKTDGKKVVFDIMPANRTPLHFELTWDGDYRLTGKVSVRRDKELVTGDVVLRKRTD
ncbi:MAG TPA: hypothetical protein VGL72_01845 [Bryobacteraceae bacterium]